LSVSLAGICGVVPNHPNLPLAHPIRQFVKFHTNCYK
jgi:hypothetical protein